MPRAVKIEKLFPLWGCSSAGRAPRSQRGGQRFDPAQLHQKTNKFGIDCTSAWKWRRGRLLDFTLASGVTAFAGNFDGVFVFFAVGTAILLCGHASTRGMGAFLRIGHGVLLGLAFFKAPGNCRTRIGTKVCSFDQVCGLRLGPVRFQCLRDEIQ